jgi:hypothetical protein
MTLSLEDALKGAVQWLQNIRSFAEEAHGVALVMLDTQPENITLVGLLKALNDPKRLTENEKELIRQGKLIPYVKAIRDRTKLDMRQSKALADEWIASERAAGRLPPKVPTVPNTPKMLEPTPACGTRITEDVITAEDIASFIKDDESPVEKTAFPIVKRTIGPNDETPADGTTIPDDLRAELSGSDLCPDPAPYAG